MISLVSVALLAMSLISSSAAVPTSSWWQPAAGTTWQCVLDQPVGSLTLPVQVYDFDLFDTPQSSIDTLHAAGKQVICYFSGGTYEPGRPDSDTILSDSAAVGAALDGWPDEKWLDIRTDFIVNIMKARIDTAASKGCDGVDPDNVDGYDNGGGGFSENLTSTDSVTYLRKLADYAHSKGLAIGLKNAGAIVDSTVSFLDWSVNEQCIEFEECDLFAPFIEAGKPVFHIEYLNQSPDVQKDCYGPGTSGFSTILKPDESDLPATVQFCPPKSS
ncbi:glycoside hydrolase superfamily [Hyaloscypha sp. PMI_1271]|nr:glycoside hydrolase superfamily [Hyaloscypha sp. PMI_1271]